MTPEEKKARKREADKRYRETHKEKLREKSRKYAETHKEEIRARQKAWAEKNKDLINKRNRERYKENPEVFKARNDKYIESHKDYVKERSKKYQQQRIEYNRHKTQTDPKFRFRRTVWTLINKYMRQKGYTGTKKVWEIVGCDFETFLSHIQGQFEEGMSLENYGIGQGKWNIDHIVPISQAESNEDIERLNHYTNLRPMWSIENIRKGKKTPK